MKAFNVRLNGELIDTVFYTPNKGETVKDAEENTRRSLIDHDGYDAGIVVRKACKSAINRCQDTLIDAERKRLDWMHRDKSEL